METIRTYLENMFMTLPKNRDVLRAKEELLNMMEDKYSELKKEGRTENEAVGIVISEFGNLNELAEDLGLSDTLKRMDDEPKRTVISLETAKDFIQNHIKASYKIATGVLLCIWSPILLILLSSRYDESFFGVKNGGTALGMVVLFTMVAFAIGLFIMSGVELNRYELATDGRFLLDHDASSHVRAEEDRNKMSMATKITIGVILCIFSSVPIIMLGILEVEEYLLVYGVGVLLFTVGFAVFLFITAGMRQSAYQILLKKGDYTEEARNRSKKAELIGGFYWPIIVIIYLYWSFTTGNWHYTWIIWPLAGLLFAAVTGLWALMSKDRTS